MSESERQPLLPNPNGSNYNARDPSETIDDELQSTVSSSVSNPGGLLQEDSSDNSNSRFFNLIKRIPLAGFILVLFACLSMTTAGVIVKLMTDTDPFMLTVYRNCVIFLCSVPRLAFYRINPEPEGKRWKLFARAILSAVYSASLFYSFRYMPLGDARAISATHPIFVTLLACMFVREPCGVFEIVSLIVTLAGMIVVMHPPFIFGSDSSDDVYNKQFFIAASFAAVGTVCQAGGFVVTRTVKDVDFAGKREKENKNIRLTEYNS